MTGTGTGSSGQAGPVRPSSLSSAGIKWFDDSWCGLTAHIMMTAHRTNTGPSKNCIKTLSHLRHLKRDTAVSRRCSALSAVCSHVTHTQRCTHSHSLTNTQRHSTSTTRHLRGFLLALRHVTSLMLDVSAVTNSSLTQHK